MATILFDCEFEGTFADSVHGISPTSIGEGISLEASTRMFGSGCCKQTGVFSIDPTTLFSDGVTLSNAQSAIHSPHHYGPMLFDKDAMTLAWGDAATPVPITGDGIYTLLYNDDPTETIDATVVVSELPVSSEWHDPIYLEGTPLVYTPTEELITALKENGFTVSAFQQHEQEYTPPVGDTIPHNTTYHIATVFEKVTEGYNFYIFVEGILQMPMQYLPDIYIDMMITNTFTLIPCFSWIDSFQVIAGALWTADFTPPSSGISGGGDRYWVGLIKSNPTVFGWYGINNYAPKFWFQWGNFFAVDPLPDASYSLILYEADAPSAALTGTTSVPSELPAEFQTLLVDFACYVLSLKLKKWKQAARYYNKYINDLNKKRRDFLLSKEVDEKKRRVLPDQVVYSDGRPWQH